MTEGFTTLVARVRLFFGVDSPVFYEKGALAESSATLVTLIGLLSCVDPLMLNE